MKRKTVKCPYCGAQATLQAAAVVHGNRADADERLWICSRYPKCDSYVGVHKRDNRPLGTLADKRLRRKRISAHAVFNLLWKSNLMSRRQAYKWLQAKLALNSSQTHIGMFSEYMCDQVIVICSTALQNNDIAVRAFSEVGNGY